MKCVLEKYFSVNDNKQIRKFILDQRKPDKYNLSNRLIELPDGNIKQIIKEQYIQTQKGEEYMQSEIGTVSIEEQLEGIKQMSLFLLMINRVGKECKEKAKNIDEKISTTLFYNGKNMTEQLKKEIENLKSKEKKYNDALKGYMIYKDNILNDLIANLYVLKHTTKEEEFSMLYGNRQDKKGDYTFAIDLPKVGQICVHYGSQKKMEAIRETAIKRAKTIIKKKYLLGQLSYDEAIKKKDEVNEENIMPEYQGRLYEYVSAIPLEYSGEEIKKVSKQLSVFGKLPEQITAEDINTISETTLLNDREKYYLALKLGVTGNRIIQLIENMDSRQQTNSATILGKQMLNSTNPEERRNAENTQKRMIYKNGKML